MIIVLCFGGVISDPLFSLSETLINQVLISLIDSLLYVSFWSSVFHRFIFTLSERFLQPLYWIFLTTILISKHSFLFSKYFVYSFLIKLYMYSIWNIFSSFMSKDTHTQIHSHSHIHTYLVSSSCTVFFFYKVLCCFGSWLQYQTVQKRLMRNVYVCLWRQPSLN